MREEGPNEWRGAAHRGGEVRGGMRDGEGEVEENIHGIDI